MLPRQQVREEFHRLFQGMTVPKTKTKGRLPRFLEQDLPAVNVITFSDVTLIDEHVHNGYGDLEYSQTVVVELHMPFSNSFEDELDRLEEDFWVHCSAFEIAGIDLAYTGSEVTEVKEVDNPHGIRLLSFAARYSVNSATPNTIIT